MWSRVLKPPYDVGVQPVRVGDPADPVLVAGQEAEAQVAAILARAREEATAILEEAEAKAATIREQARQDGHREGREAALAEARARLETALGPVLSTLDEAVAGLEALTKPLRWAQDAVVLAVAAALAEQVLGEALADPDRWLKRAADLLEALDGSGEDPVRVYCPPSLVEFARSAADRLAAGRQQIKILADRDLGLTDVVVEGAAGGLDGRLRETLQHMVEEVLHGESGPLDGSD